MRSLSGALRRLSELTGRLLAWLMIPMVLGTFLIVIFRYALDLGWIWMQEGTVWVHAAVFMVAAAYTLNRNEHVRVDVFYRGMSVRRKACVDLAGAVLFLIPVAMFLVITSWDYVAVSWQIREGSREAGGLPYPFTSILKSFIPLTAVLLILQGIANVIDNVLTLAAGPSIEGAEKRTAAGGGV
jgi:TRAP-type mannitol/chloroaromatic compound transport system permease small subunit